MKKFLVSLLCFMMVLTFMPTMAFADGESVNAIGEEGGTLSSGTYELTSDVTLTTDLTIPADAEVNIDLKGHTLTGSGTNSVITVYGTLTVKDSGTTGKITGGQGPSEDSSERKCGGGGIYVALGAELTFENGTITGNKASHGGGIRVDGTLYMTGGKVTENEATLFGGGIYSDGTTVNDEITGGIINISGGVVSENKAVHGGGIRGGGASFLLSGDAVIRDNTASGSGGGVYSFRSFNLSGGTISENKAEKTGGGVFVQGSTGSFTMEGGTISENTATSNGGGVYTAGKFTMSSGTISKNEAATGGGIDCVGGTMSMSGGSIAENTATANGGGVRASGTSFTMTGGEISKNKAANGGGVDCTAGTMSMSGGSIAENTATTNGGGVRAGGTSFTMTSGEISKNTATGGQGGGIWASKPATISAGKIIGNSASTFGGGIFISGNAPVTISGGEVTENIVTSATGGAGIYFATSGALHVSGSPVITGNKANGSTEQNVYLPDKVYITLDGALDSASIGITPGNSNLPNINAPLQITVSESTTSYYSSSHSCFKADVPTRKLSNDNCIVIPQTNTTDGKKCVELAIYVSRTVTFNSNDGESAQTKIQAVPKEKATALEANTFERTGYTFQNWSTQQNGGDTTYQDGADITTANDVTLYAQWKANEYDITYKLNGGTAGENAPDTHTYDTATTLVAPTRTGYTFGGWFTSSDFSGTKVTSLGATDYTDDITLYALWTKQIDESTTVNAIPDQTYTGAEIKPAVVVKNGDTVLTSGYTVDYSNNTNVGTAKATVTVGSNKAEVEFEIVKDTSPTVEMDEVSVIYGDSYAMTATAKTSAGNKITGGDISIKYYTDEACTGDGTDTAPTSAGIYYAKATLTETDNYAVASKIAKITISKATLTAPALTNYTAATTSITVTAPTVPAGASKVQYSIDNGANWQDSNVFSGLTSGTSYSVNARFVADNSGNYADSANSTALSVRTNSVGTSHYPTVQKPVIETSEGVTASLNSTGMTASITVADGYEITDVTVNGVSKGAVTTLTGLKTGDKVVITAQKITSADDNAALIETVKNTRLVARSMYAKAPSGKKSIKVYWFNKDGSELNFDGYEVYRSLKKDSGYGTKPIFKTTKARYYNTAIKKGTKYYYKVRAYKVINGEKVYTQYSLKAWRTAK